MKNVRAYLHLIGIAFEQIRKQKREIEALQTKYKATDYERRLATLAHEKLVLCKERDAVLKV